MRALSKKCTLDERTPQELQTSVRPNPSRRAEGPNTDVRPRSANLPRPSMAGAFFRRWQRRTNLWRRRTNLRTGSERLTGVIRRHGRGHGALVSHSTDVGCISEENTCEEATSNWNYCIADGNIGPCTILGPRRWLCRSWQQRSPQDQPRLLPSHWNALVYLVGHGSLPAWRNGSYDDGKGVRHQLVQRFPNGRYTLQVYHNGVRVK